MPRRLGDDPLSRKRSTSTKDAPSARSGLAAQPTSHNDVFFQRRTETPQPKLEGIPDKQSSFGEAVNAGERPEITEVADLVRTAQVAKSTQGAEQLSVPAPIESISSFAEEPIVRTEQSPSTLSESVANPEPPTPATEEPVVAPSSQPEEQPQKSEGFFKRLFGRFGK